MSRVGCAGILVADTFCGPMDMLPIEGQLLAIEAMVTRAGGCAANVAISLAKQGILSTVYGCLGKDPPAQVVLQALKDANVNVEDIQFTADFPTSQTVILLVEGEDRRYIHVFGANKAFSTDKLVLDHLKNLDVFYLGGLFAMPSLQTQALRDVLKFCQDNGVQTVVDVVLPHYHEGVEGLDELLPYIDYFLPNNTEAEQITGKHAPLEQIHAFREYGANQVIITRGTQGAVAATGDDYWKCGVFEVDTIDPSGSGDAFAAGIITGMVKQWGMEQTLRYATAIAASCTLRVGTTDGVFTSGQVVSFLEAHELKITRLVI
jgi:sugar/nucleoside kinase (ribokinase family)